MRRLAERLFLSLLTNINIWGTHRLQWPIFLFLGTTMEKTVTAPSYSLIATPSPQLASQDPAIVLPSVAHASPCFTCAQLAIYHTLAFFMDNTVTSDLIFPSSLFKPKSQFKENQPTVCLFFSSFLILGAPCDNVLSHPPLSPPPFFTPYLSPS